MDHNMSDITYTLYIFFDINLKLDAKAYFHRCTTGYVATRLMYRLICNLPELNIRIFNPKLIHINYT